jgi:hypothetical protein
MKADRLKKSQKELAKTRLLKISKTSRIVTAFNRHKTESQMVTIVTVTMRYLGANFFLPNPRKTNIKLLLKAQQHNKYAQTTPLDDGVSSLFLFCFHSASLKFFIDLLKIINKHRRFIE